MQSNLKILIITILAAYMLAVMPVPDWADTLRPDWVTLVIIYWAMALPDRIGVTIAWVAGLFLDVAHGSILGQHALGLVVITYIVHTQHQRIRVASLLQQSIFIFFLLFLKQLLVLWVDGMVGHAPDTWLYFTSSLFGAALWPWVFIVLRDLRRKFGYRSM